MNKQEILIWDLPLRVFHWALALSVTGAWLTGEVGGGWIDVHAKIGLGIVGLIAFRLCWGFVGSTYARFLQFFPSPSKVLAYIGGRWVGQGHNPLGALSVFALLVVLALQVATGLVANDDIAFAGPLYELVGKAWSDRLTAIHHLSATLIMVLALGHVLAIVFYVRFCGKNLVKPMFYGRVEGDTKFEAKGGGRLAVVVSILFAVGVVYLAQGGAMSPVVEEKPVTPAW